MKTSSRPQAINNPAAPHIGTESWEVYEMDSMIWPDDNLRLICHQDFDRYLLLAMQVKEITDAIARGSLVSPTEFLESTDHEAACKLGKTIKMAQLPPGVGMPPTLVRGKFPWIDALMEHVCI